MTTNPAAGAVYVEKLMSLSRAEFEKSVTVLGGAGIEIDDGRAELRTGAGRVAITFHALPPKRFGGLLLLPQARVAVEISGLDEGAAVDFLRRFDLAFQRGGG